MSKLPQRPSRRGRQHLRFGLERDVRVTIPGWTSTARGVDISRGGLALDVGDKIRVGDRLRFWMTTAEGRMVTLEAEVRKIDRHEGGRRAHLEWVNLEEDARDALEAFVESVAHPAA